MPTCRSRAWARAVAALLAALTVWVWAWVWSGAAPARAAELPGIQGPDDRRPVIAGGPQAGADYPWPWRAIGRVNRNTGGFCTGTLIAPDLVLTAGHCLESGRVGQLPPESLHFVAAYRFGDYDAHGRIAAIHRPVADGPRGDFALLRLTEALDIRPLPLTAPPADPTPIAVHARVLLAGYSQDRPHLLAIDDACFMLGLRTDALWRHDCDGPKGSSGGPILVGAEEGGAPRVAGISIGFAAGGPHPRGVMVPTPVIRAFLDKRGLAVAVPE
ncbi:trypsin-like serine peptidase [Roseospira goensis]|uniref:Protease YdgD n=1 Tax=Roseospira goensis TaxID=391922 RepID=A0A7W6WKA2_9PROT|nr:trypsin-like serine protease [Roseospira goensis]MBB4285227.1 protease YdgD [Roseospira goensis]